MVTNSTMQEKGLTSSQQSRNMFSGQSCSQEVQRPKPGEPGWLVSIADCLEEGGMDRMKHQVKDKREKPKPSSQQSKDMFSVQTSSQEVQRLKPRQWEGEEHPQPVKQGLQQSGLLITELSLLTIRAAGQ